MAQTPGDLLTRAGDILQDTSNARWSQAELLRYLNDGRRELSIYRPDLFSTTYTLTLEAGTKQSIPSDGTRFMDAIRNVSAEDAPGRAVRIVERETLDAQSPDWHTETATSTHKHFTYDEGAPRTFYVYPPAVGGNKLDIVYAKAPVDLVTNDLNSATVLAAENIYTGALLDYVLYRAFSKDADYAGNLQRAGMHYQGFANALGIGNRKRYSTSPNLVKPDGVAPKATTIDA